MIHQVKILTCKININISNSEKLQVSYLFVVHTASYYRIISEYLTGRNMQGRSNGLIWGNILTFIWRDWGTPVTKCIISPVLYVCVWNLLFTIKEHTLVVWKKISESMGQREEWRWRDNKHKICTLHHIRVIKQRKISVHRACMAEMWYAYKTLISVLAGKTSVRRKGRIIINFI